MNIDIIPMQCLMGSRFIGPLIVFLFLFTLPIKSQRISIPEAIKTLNVYNLGDSTNLYGHLIQVDSLENPFSIEK